MATPSVQTEFASKLEKFWQDDYTPLLAAGKAVNAALRADEQDADLYTKLTSNKEHSHLYFADDTKDVPPPLFSVQHLKTVPLSPLLQSALKNYKKYADMGLFEQMNLAWMIADDTLYLWGYGKTSTGTFCSFKVPSGEIIICAGLVPPKKGIFKPNVESCLVVSTAAEVLVCALVRIDVASESKRYMENGDGGSLKLVPTQFSLGTDGVRMLAVAGTENGRIFLGGDDGCLYEMTLDLGIPEKTLTIDEKLELFYDEGENLPSVVTADDEINSVPAVALKLGKRLLQSLDSGYSPPRKCQKINRSSQVSAAVKAVVPEFIINTTSFIFGSHSASSGGRISQIVVDEVRQTLYTLSVEGWICSYDLSGPNDARLACAMDCSRTLRLYLEAVARGQMFPPSTSHSSSSLGNIAFPGGGTAAQAGVGGMDGARSILKLAEHRSASARDRNREAFAIENILKPISIQVVAPTDSSRLTLVAVTEGGLRLFLSSLAPNVIGSGPNTTKTYGTRIRNPFLPWHRMTLCHVRAPPPIIRDNQEFSSIQSTRVEGGIIPRVHGSRSNRVDACMYKQGIFFAAFTSGSQRNGLNRSDNASGKEQRPGDIIVATCSDEILRKIENSTPASSGLVDNTDKRKQENLTVKGGLAETISLPMASAYGGSSPDLQATLPGGIVWGVAEISSKDDPLYIMTVDSQTPTESELSVGLPPAFVPPSKVREREGLQTKESNGISSAFGGPRSTKSSALVSKDLPIDQVKVLGNVLTNFLLSRPLRQGLPLSAYQGHGNHFDDNEPCYRLSKYECFRGFSSSAGESSPGLPTAATSRQKVTGSTMSARLRPWLLRPATVPLNPFSSQLYYEAKEFVALNAGGLHFFGKKSVLACLAEALIDASDNVQNDLFTTSFFAGYTYKEGCCMCLALAVGCGPILGNAGFNEQLRSRALDAALARAFVPKLVRAVDVADPAIVSGISCTADPLVPQGYAFHASALSDGLHSLFSRLVRPIWHKPAVVVTEGRTIKLHAFNRPKVTPAKVEILLNEATLDKIKFLLTNMMDLMKKTFSRAIKSVPGASQQQGNSMEIDENEDEQYLTRALLYRSQVQVASADSRSQLTSFEADNIARLIEERNIHSLYRLLARVVQLLNLMSLLRRAEGMTELKEVDWGLLHGLTIAQLVQTSEGQERLESLLNSLVTISASNRSYTTVKSAQADHLASCFADQCYLFFSPGSRFAYLGLRKADEALNQPMTSSNRVSLANQAAQHFCQAAQHWHSAPLITGRILHTQGKETFQQIAYRAMQFESPLAKAVEALIELEDVANAVEVCLLTASNFRADSTASGHTYMQFRTQQKYEFGWEQNLYHRKRDIQRNGETLVATAAGSPSTSQIIAYGTEVTAKDAVDTCYALIFHHLSELLASKYDLAESMVSACSAASDPSFLKSFFGFLLESNHTDTLLRIDSPALEIWLRERRDPDLLWRYFNVQRRNEEAGQVALDRAYDASLKLPLGERVEWLSRSVNSFHCAVEEASKARLAVNSSGPVSQKAKEVSDALHVARLQSRILAALESSRPEDLTPELYEKLSTSLLPISDLYNDYAAAYSLFEECLLILHACRHDHISMIQTLWKNVFCEEILPCATRNQSIYNFLQDFVAELELGDQVAFLSNGKTIDSIMIFEDGQWEKSLFSRTVALGKQLYGSGADYVFPKNFILRCLEGLRQQVSSHLSPGWALLVLADVGVPFLEIMDAYESVSNHDRVLLGGIDSEVEIERIAGFLEIMNYWLSLSDSNVRSMGTRGYVAYQQLSRAKASGRLYNKLDAVKAKIEGFPAATSILEQLEAIEEKIRT